MTIAIKIVLTSLAASLWVGCVLDPTGVSQAVHADKVKKDAESAQQRALLKRKFENNPDTDAWYDQRQKLALAVGDRVFQHGFARVIDSLTLAVSSLELKVNNLERASGYIAATGIALAPSEAREMRRNAVNEWCRINGFDPSILDRPYRTKEGQQMAEMMDFSDMMAKYEKMQRGLTFQLVKMGDTQTKVKLRFSDVYYPPEIEAYYKMVWEAVDKQIFVDHNVEGGVEKRE